LQIHGSAPNLVTVLVTVVVVLGIDLAAALYFIQDLYRPERRVRGSDKQFWMVVILLGSVIGMAAYVLYGREV
jgi:hypothetical protein